MDILPTLCEVVGAPVPRDRKIDGTSILPLLTGTGNIQRQTPLFWFFYRVAPAASMRMGDWNMVGYLDQGLPKNHSLTQKQMTWLKKTDLVKFELYNLRQDIGQSMDLSAQEKERFESMKKKMTAMHQEILSDGPTWFVEKEPVWEKGKVLPAVKEGCMDSSYVEYDDKANVHDADKCKTTGMAEPAGRITWHYEGNRNGLVILRQGGGAESFFMDVYDLHGKRVSHIQSQDGKRLFWNTNGLDRGMYFLRVTTSKDRRILKWVY